MKLFKAVFLFIILALISISCVNTNSKYLTYQKLDQNGSPLLKRNLYIDLTFDDMETSAIISAAEDWECSTRGLVHFEIHTKQTEVNYDQITDISNSIIIQKVDVDNKFIIKSDEKSDDRHSTAGLFMYDQNNNHYKILIVGSRMGSYFEYFITTLHELNHSFGSGFGQHSPTRNSILWKNLEEGSKKITQYDLNRFCTALGCDSTKLKSCDER